MKFSFSLKQLLIFLALGAGIFLLTLCLFLPGGVPADAYARCALLSSLLLFCFLALRLSFHLGLFDLFLYSVGRMSRRKKNQDPAEQLPHQQELSYGEYTGRDKGPLHWLEPLLAGGIFLGLSFLL